MAYEVTMPRLGWTMEEGIFGEWLQQDGDDVQPGDLLFTVEGDKATQEVEVFEGGILRLPPDAPVSGDVIPVGALLAYIVQAGESMPELNAQPAEPVARGGDPPAAADQPSVTQATSTGSPETEPRDRPRISPRARRVAGELGVDWTMLTGSGSSGRIIERDVRAAAEIPEKETVVDASPVARRLAAEAGIDLEALAAGRPGRRIQREDVEASIAAGLQPVQEAGAAATELAPHTRIRQITAQRMAESARTTAPVTLTTEAGRHRADGASAATEGKLRAPRAGCSQPQ